jgi:acyl-CoA thioesterase-1
MDRATLKITALGDSLTAGFGVRPEESYPWRLAQILNSEGLNCRITNAGRNGDTCRGVLSRLDRVAADRPDWVILEIGVNDILMGALAQRIEANLRAIVERLKSEGIATILAAMELPPLGDPEGERAFAALYPRVAQAYALPLISGFLNPVFEAPGRVQSDGLHPNAAGYAAITRHLAPYVGRALKSNPPTPSNPI